MSAICLTEDCRNCRWHVIRSSKLDCNYNDRLGLGKPDLGKFSVEEEEKKSGVQEVL